MSQRQIVGICILIVGVILLGLGFNATQAPAEELAESFTGQYSDQTVAYLIAGAVGVVAGLAITFTGGKR